MKTIPKWAYILGMILFAVILYLFVWPEISNAQILKSVDHVKVTGGYDLVTTVTITDAQAINIIRSLGTDKTVGDVKAEIGTETLRAVKRIVEMAESNNKGRWMNHLSPSAWDAARIAYEAEEAEKKRIADSIANAQEIGMITGPIYGGAEVAFIGKSYGRPTMGSWSDLNFAEQYAKAKEVYGQQADPFGRGSSMDPETSSPPSASSRLSQPSSSSDWHSSKHGVGMLSDSDVWYIRGLIVLGLILGTVIIVSIVS